MHLGRPYVIGAWAVGDTVVDPGPESCVETLLAGLASPPLRLLLTHIHLDHAGAAGALVERFPDLEVCVHAAGAPHVIDPSKLLSSAGRLYGDRMDELWGRVLPVPAENVTILEGGETLEGDVHVHYTPGHASHHVCYMIDGIAYTGDVAGVVIGPSGYVLMPTPPPDIDVEAWAESIDLIRSLEPRGIHITHFGAVAADPQDHLERAAARLHEWAELARTLDLDGFVEAVKEAVAGGSDADTAAYIQASPPHQLYAGLSRYWCKREEP